MVPISPKTQQLITHTIQESIERVLRLPLKLANSHGITLLTFSPLVLTHIVHYIHTSGV
jgi:hypothetical protein